ncbi:hypothetical protein BDV95DRAFT_609371 [Massariosphaeria phaeospora]|uniref:F-box domain-containing protein n=1 Tax=Massariosphaeria phaeospora TaxID=100035 RepID=A0A7C8I2H5_9PLEO|nr:hypothetical protein BDV95DRAFT_609371 [Massariosphaeria phaeospora]
MTASPFTTLPSELICQVFEYAADFSVVAALAQTARVFCHTWRENPTSICRAVAPRAISNFTDAERLLDVQEEAAKWPRDDREPKSLIRAKRLQSNARCASAAADAWGHLVQKHSGREEYPDPPMTPSELARFKHTFYCVWTAGVMTRAPHLRDQALPFLDKCNPRELFRLDELAIWASYYNENDFGSAGLALRDEVWMDGYDLVQRCLQKIYLKRNICY